MIGEKLHASEYCRTNAEMLAIGQTQIKCSIVIGKAKFGRQLQ